MSVVYEWVVEEMDGDEIVDTSAYRSLGTAKAMARKGAVISLRRDVGNNVDGMTDRQFAYPGATEFDGGAAIPKGLLADFASLSEERG